MVRREPPLRLPVEFEHGKVRYPDGPESRVSGDLLALVSLRGLDHLISHGRHAMPVGITPGQLYAKIPRRRIDRDLSLGKMSLCLGVARLHMGRCVSGPKHQQVLSCALGPRRHQFTYL